MINEKIIGIRQKKRLSQSEFGEILKITTDTISRVERGQQDVDLKMLNGLAIHFDVNIHELITGEVLDIPEKRITELETENRLMRELLDISKAHKKKA
jgi:transcriptional regulator with XRE-family HTH domain